MEQKSLRRRLAALLLMLCLLAAGALPALATSANIRLVDASGNPATGTIRVALYDSAKDKALSGGQLTLYRVAEVKRKNGDLSFEYCGDFYGCGIALGDLTDSTLADQLLEYMPQGAKGTTKTVDVDGNAAFEDLELGLYLIVQSKASNGYAPIKPFLVSLPMAENGKWNYEVDASPKVGGYTPVNPDKYDLFLTLRSVPGAIWKGLLLAAVLVGCAMLLPALSELFDFCERALSLTDLPLTLFVPVVKVTAIALVARFSCALCADAGQSALSSLLAAAGTLCALVCALPLMEALLEMVEGFL